MKLKINAMKKIVLLSVLALFISCSSDEPIELELPRGTTNIVTRIRTTEVFFSGWYESNDYKVLDSGFEVSTSQDFSQNTIAFPANFASSGMPHAEPNTLRNIWFRNMEFELGQEYFYKIYVITDTQETIYGNVLSFQFDE